MSNNARHCFGSSNNIQNALTNGIIKKYDMLFLDDKSIGWINDNNEVIILDALPNGERDFNVVKQFDKKSDFPILGNSNYIYIDSENQFAYWWTGSTYARISASVDKSIEINNAINNLRNELNNNHGKIIYYNTKLEFPTVGNSINVYIDKTDSIAYYWNGIEYKLISTDISNINSNIIDINTNINNIYYSLNNIVDNKVDKEIGMGLSDNNFSDEYKFKIDNLSNNYVEKQTGKGLSTNDYTTIEQIKLLGIENNAEVNVQSDWNETDTSSDMFIKNKPILGTASSMTPEEINNEITKSQVISSLGYTPLNASSAGISIATLDAMGKLTASQIPESMNNVVEYNNISLFPNTGKSGIIYIDKSNSKAYIWNGATYCGLGDGVVLGDGATNAYYGDRGKVAYDHALTKGNNSYSIGLYKLAVNNNGHVITAIPVEKSDIVALGIPDSSTGFTAGEGITIDGTSLVNSGVRDVADGKTNGCITANINGVESQIRVKGLGSGAYSNLSDYVTSASLTPITTNVTNLQQRMTVVEGFTLLSGQLSSITNNINLIDSDTDYMMTSNIDIPDTDFGNYRLELEAMLTATQFNSTTVSLTITQDGSPIKTATYPISNCNSNCSFPIYLNDYISVSSSCNLSANISIGDTSNSPRVTMKLNAQRLK